MKRLLGQHLNCSSSIWEIASDSLEREPQSEIAYKQPNLAKARNDTLENSKRYYCNLYEQLYEQFNGRIDFLKDCLSA